MNWIYGYYDLYAIDLYANDNEGYAHNIIIESGAGEYAVRICTHNGKKLAQILSYNENNSNFEWLYCNHMYEQFKRSCK